MLRYNEPLKLNRKGHQAIFRSITRNKRNNLADGKNGHLDKTPDAAYYKPKLNIIRKEPFQADLGAKNIDSLMDEVLARKDKLTEQEQIVCEKLTR